VEKAFLLDGVSRVLFGVQICLPIHWKARLSTNDCMGHQIPVDRQPLYAAKQCIARSGPIC
jgi:hypothetical protein